MRNISGGNMSSSARQLAPRWRPDVSQNTSAVRGHFDELTAEERTIYRKWRRAVVVFYGVVAAAIAALAIGMAPVGSSMNADTTAAHSAIASAGQRDSR
jgi:hypothetical protein